MYAKRAALFCRGFLRETFLDAPLTPADAVGADAQGFCGCRRAATPCVVIFAPLVLVYLDASSGCRRSPASSLPDTHTRLVFVRPREGGGTNTCAGRFLRIRVDLLRYAVKRARGRRVSLRQLLRRELEA